MTLSHILIIGLFLLLGGMGMSAIQNAIAIMLRTVLQQKTGCGVKEEDMLTYSQNTGKTAWKTSF